MTIMHIWYFPKKEHSGEIAGRYTVRPFFPLFGVFSFVETLFIGSVSLGWSGWASWT